MLFMWALSKNFITVDIYTLYHEAYQAELRVDQDWLVKQWAWDSSLSLINLTLNELELVFKKLRSKEMHM